MTLSEVYDACLKAFASKGVKEEQLQLTVGQLTIVMPQGDIRIQHYDTSYFKPISIEAHPRLLGRGTQYTSFNKSFFARIEKAIDKSNELSLEEKKEIQAQKNSNMKLEKSLIPYIKEYGNVFKVKNGAVYTTIGKVLLKIDLKTEQVLLMSYGHSRLNVPMHLFIPLLKEMEMEQLLGA